MKILAIINQKGGVGKSTTAAAIGTGLAIRGHKVLFIDLDAQGNLSYVMSADTQRSNAMGILQRPETAANEIQHTAQGDIIASTPELAAADTIITATGKEYRLKEALENISGAYEYCIIDTPPALGILTVNALTACQGVIIPAQADIYSLQGINQLYGTIQAVKHYCNASLEIMGIVLTRYNSRAIISRDISAALEQTARKLNTRLYNARIRECIALKEAQAMRQSIFKYAPRSNAAVDYSALIDEIQGRKT